MNRFSMQKARKIGCVICTILLIITFIFYIVTMDHASRLESDDDIFVGWTSFDMIIFAWEMLILLLVEFSILLGIRYFLQEWYMRTTLGAVMHTLFFFVAVFLLLTWLHKLGWHLVAFSCW